MNKKNTSINRIIDYVLPSFVLLFLFIYTYAKFFEHPYTGFRLDSAGNVFKIFVEQHSQPLLQIGDRVIEINSVKWEDYRQDLRKIIFSDIQPGQMISLLVKRSDREILIPWQLAGFNTEEVWDLVISEGWLGFFFWATGTFALLTLRPRDERWRLFIAFNYLTAAFLVLGSGVSFHHIWQSAILMRIFVWFCIPVYLHLHWVFPKPLGALPKAIIWVGYLGVGLVAIAQWFEAIPDDLFYTGYLLAVLGSVVILLIHAVRQPDTRRDLGILLVVILIAFIPSVALTIISVFLSESLGELPAGLEGGALVSLALFPAAYMYAVHRRRLGNLELRINNLLSSFIFLTIVGTLLLPFIVLVAANFSSVAATITFGTAGFLFASVVVLFGYSRFRTFFGRRILGIPLTSKGLLETYSNRITTSNSLPALIQVLKKEILPTLLIRQFAFLHIDQGSVNVLSSMGLKYEPLPSEKDLSYIADEAGIYRSPDLLSNDQPYSWIRLILPLKLGDEIIGFWLLGRRDPDDLYSQQEIPILHSLANLTAIALRNILQTEDLKSMYETNISRYEQERLRLAHDLHDSILNEMAALLMRGDAPNLSPEFQRAVDGLTDRLREIVDHLRPPMLAFGLKLALEGFAEDLIERNQEVVEVLSDIQSDGEWRYPEVVENNLYRIVQEACENSLRHARAKTIMLFGRLHEHEIEIKVNDDGIGLHADTSLRLNDLLANKHFGLVGMFERAKLINASLNINSSPHKGTEIQIFWNADKDQADISKE